MMLPPTFRTPLLLLGAAAGLLLGLSGCDGDGSGDGSVRTHSQATYATGSHYDLGVSGYGGRPTADRSQSDPLRYAYYGLPLRPALSPLPLVLFNTGYVVGYDTQRQLPLWVCYRLSDQNHATQESSKRETASAQVDPRLGSHQVMPDPKAKDGIHGLPLAPASSLTASYGDAAGQECDYTSNVAPCATPRGWQQLVELESRYAHSNHELWVITGPVFKDDASREITAIWKIQIVVQMGKTVTQAFLLPLASAPAERRGEGVIDLSSAVTTIAEIERQAHLALLPQLHDIDGQTVTEVVSLPAPSVWPGDAAVASVPASTAGRR